MASVAAARRLGRLAANSTYFFLCDMQEKFRPSIKYYPEIITVASRMVSVWVWLGRGHSPYSRYCPLSLATRSIVRCRPPMSWTSLS